jgi:hypothetical protein
MSGDWRDVLMRHEAEHKRIVEAYLKMAEEAKYRPAAPGDGMGNVYLTAEEIADPDILQKEAVKYADEFLREEDLHFTIGVSDFSTNRALVYTVEAARALCGVNHDLASTLLKMAAEETRAAKKERGT